MTLWQELRWAMCPACGNRRAPWAVAVNLPGQPAECDCQCHEEPPHDYCRRAFAPIE